MEETLSILVVDDHDGMRHTLEDILEDEGYEITTANSGYKAIELCQNQKFDVIIMDVKMPDLNGVETYQRIKKFTQKTRVIMMSAYSVEELKRMALKTGAIAFLQKPLDVEVVLSLIQETEHPSVLLVMPNQQEQETLVPYLNQHGYRTYTSSTSAQALELASQIHFSVILIDTNLQDNSGLELYLTLKKITPTSVAIMLADTGQDFLQQALDAVKQNAYTFLSKPLDITKLLEILEYLHRQQRSNILEKPELNNV